MPIPVEVEDIEFLKSWGMGLGKVHERCRFCSIPTDTWYDKHTPICPRCAGQYEVRDI
jgi:hypothetical protein